MRRLPFIAHLTAGEIDRRFRACGDVAEKTRWLVLRLLSASPPPSPAEAPGRPGTAPTGSAGC
jgi:hypothetical protein